MKDAFPRSNSTPLKSGHRYFNPFIAEQVPVAGNQQVAITAMHFKMFCTFIYEDIFYHAAALFPALLSGEPELHQSKL